jgi:phosphoribosylformylglycinamidine cyclo-ligase
MLSRRKSITYKEAGVDINKGNLFVDQIKSIVSSTKKEGAISDIGSFGGLFGIDAKKYKSPILVSTTDGVGTKLMIAQQTGRHNTVGIDLVGMCVNDIATTGAKPLFFLDYIATGKIEPKVLKEVVAGIAAGCREAGYALVGGETAEMPDMYRPNEYDLAGFCVGIIDKNKIIDGRNIRKGDKILGLASTGLHSNGYSLARKVLTKGEITKLQDELLMPTRLYVKPLLALQERIDVKGIAHITGGAYIDKIPRIIPDGLCAEIKKGSWQIPEIFALIKQKANVLDKEMYHVFNMGIGMVTVIARKDILVSQNILSGFNIKSWVIGEIVEADKKVNLI